MSWHHVAFVYLAYLVVVSFIRPEFAPARGRLVAAGTVIAALIALDIVLAPSHVWALVILPSLVLLGGYRLSGLLFVRVDPRAESWLRTSDERWLWRPGILPAYVRAPRLVHEFFELSYFLVYATIPAGAIVLLVKGEVAATERYWIVVLVAEFICYAVLPWVQTRPPMLVESPAVRSRSVALMRRLNQAIAARGSIQANTIPSGHAAGALACALAVSDAVSAAGAVFLLLALSIASASVLGRYHYLIDSLLGFGVALVVWLLV